MQNRNFETGLYIVDEDYKVVEHNEEVKKLYPNVKVGAQCYEVLALRNTPCDTCPLKDDNLLFYSEARGEWLFANAAKMQYGEHGTCYHVQFQLRRKNVRANESVKGNTSIKQRLDKNVAAWCQRHADECIIGSYCEQGSPIIFANKHMVELLGYDSEEDLFEGANYHVFNLIHPDDVKKTKSDIAGTLYAGASYVSVYRMLKKDGDWAHVICKGRVLETEEGRLTRLSRCMDMNSFIRAQSKLQEQNTDLQKRQKNLEILTQNIPGGYHRCANEEGYPFVYISKSFEEMVGWTKEEIREKFDNKFVNMVVPEDYNNFDALMDDVNGRTQGASIYRMHKKGGGHIWVQDTTMLSTVDGQAFYQGVVVDITPHIEAMYSAVEKAEASSRAKSTFLFNVSHDVRTPMNAIQGFAKIIEQSPEDEKTVAITIKKIRQASDVLMKLLNDVLEISRIEKGKDQLEPVRTNLIEHSEKLRSMFFERISSSQIDFLVDNKVEDAVVLVDELKLTRIGMNLLSNAQKFTGVGGTITSGIEQLGKAQDGYAEYRFFVRDTGIGMSKEFQKVAFEQFERERTATESGIAGSGLGLAIIRKLVDLMGGRYELKSELGKGTEISIYLRLPLAEQLDVEEKEAEVKAIDLTGKRVLLVEDNDFNREIARYMIEKHGIVVEDARNGLIALDKVMQASAGFYDAVLMDIQMPVMDGIKATQEIRRLEDKAKANVPIIAMTANAFQSDRQKSLEVGMNEHITKPIDADVLVKTLFKVLQK